MSEQPVLYGASVDDGSAPLTAGKREAFAQAVVGGASFVEAYRIAGYAQGSTRHHLRRAASKLAAVPEVADRIAYLQRSAASLVLVEQSDVLRELQRIAFADIRNVLTWDEQGVTVRPSEALTPAEAASIRKFKMRRERRVDSDGEEFITDTYEVELYDKQPALAMLGKFTGGFEGKQPPGEGERLAALLELRDRLRALPDDDLARVIEATFVQGAPA